MHDLTNKKFGYLTVKELAGKKGKYLAWLCLCDCGKEHVVSSNSLLTGNTRSCGCGKRKKPLPRPRSISKEKYAHLHYSAKVRAKKAGMEFSLELKELIVPEICPVLAIPIDKSPTGKRNDNSPSIDRIDNTKGYTKENVRVISWRANKLKGDASLKELEAIVNYMKGEL